MAKRKSGGKRKRKKAPRKSSLGGRKVKVKGHMRSPRGPNTGKKAVKVRGYARKRPRRGAGAK